jgi:uncharacterized protein YceK
MKNNQNIVYITIMFFIVFLVGLVLSGCQSTKILPLDEPATNGIVIIKSEF